MRNKSRARFLTRAWPRPGAQLAVKPPRIPAPPAYEPVPPKRTFPMQVNLTMRGRGQPMPYTLDDAPSHDAITAALERGTAHESDRAAGRRKTSLPLTVREGRYTV